MSKSYENLAELGAAYDSGALSNRNIVINGKFEVDQRHACCLIDTALLIRVGIFLN